MRCRFPFPPACVRLLSFTLALGSLLWSGIAAGQSFQQPKVILTGNWPAAIYTADVNGDGFADLIYLDQGAQPGQASTTHVLVNDGKGNFKQTAVLATFGNSLSVGALGGRGFPGTIAWVVPAVNGVTVEIAPSLGDGTYGTPAGVAASWRFPGTLPASTQFGFLVSGRTGTITGASAYSPYLFFEDLANNIAYEVLFNPDGTDALYAGQLPDGTGPEAVMPLTGASQGELIVNGLRGSTVQDFPFGLGDQSVLLQPAARFGGVSGVRSFLAQDVTADGLGDLVAEGANGAISVFAGLGDGTFAATPSPGFAVQAGSATLDGLTGNGGHLIGLTQLQPNSVGLLTSTPAGVSSFFTFSGHPGLTQLKGIYNAGPGMHGFALADFNGDGKLDVATDSPEGIAILYGNADGSFQSSSAFAAGQPALSGAVDFITASGHADLAVSTGATQAQVLTGDGSGAFTTVGGAQPMPTNPDHGLAGLWSGIATGDYNGDGLVDLAITADGPGPLLPTTGSGMTLLLGKGDGTFQPPALVTGPASPQQQPTSAAQYYGVTSDVYVNGVVDVLFTRDAQGYRFNSDLNQNFSNYGPGSVLFGTQTTATPHAHNLVLAGGFNQDGPGALQLGVIVQQDGDLFEFPNMSLNFTDPPNGDLAVDGSLTTPGQRVAPDISASFPGLSKALGYRAFLGSMANDDLDGDGNGDLLAVYADLDADRAAPSPAAPNYLYIWFGSGDSGPAEFGKFRTSAAHPVNPLRIQLSRNYYQVATADLNGDGIPDLILSDGYLVDVQYGLGDGSFGPEHHLLAGQGINSLMLADVNGDGAVDLVTANGGAVLSNPVANLDTLASNPDVNTGGVTVLLNSRSALQVPTGTLAAAPNPAAFEAGYTLTATLAAAAGGAVPTGTVSFSVDGVAAGTATLAGGLATYAVAAHGLGPGALLPGSHALTASYSGDANYAPTTSLSGSFSVSLAPTTVALTPTTPLQTFFGGPANGTFVVSTVDGSYPITGTYTVYDNGAPVPICTNLPVTLNGAPVECPYGDPILLPAGSHAFQVGYNGDAVNAPSISASVTYVLAPDLTTGTLTTSATQATVGTPVTFTATLAGNLAVPAGQVSFLDGSAVIGTGTLNAGGVATFTTSSLAVGTHTITAVFAGNQDFNAVTTAAVTVTIVAVVIPIASDVVLMSSVNPSLTGQQITLTASVVAIVPGTQPTFSGNVTFLDGTATLGISSVSAAGIATYTTSALAVGSHALTAAYSGSTGTVPILPGTSPVLMQVVTTPQVTGPASFTFSVSPVPVTVGIGRSAVLTVAVTPVNGFAQPVALTCSNLPYSISCNFVQATIPAGGTGTTLYAVTTAPHDCNSSTPYFLGQTSAEGGQGIVFAVNFLPGSLLLLALRRRRTRRLMRDLLLLALACAGMSAMSGCGHCTDLGTKPGTYSFTVTATSQGGPVNETVSQKIQLTATD